jgi:hypothetical protein
MAKHRGFADIAHLHWDRQSKETHMNKSVTTRTFIITVVIGAALIYGYLTLNEYVQEVAGALKLIMGY